MNVNGSRSTWNPGREWLEQKYIAEGKILSEIASEAGVSSLTVQWAIAAVILIALAMVAWGTK
jgi:hypothetical protein